ncbi:hypothetical protein Poly51_59240 [Rubripirellula tenax]|uniref:PhnB-like domain-containing protein n=1 Tax=Rubripirellula tenax TaxID=2528015 RepID=A0A5C6E812_9BACT|nr:VOC family protein [Rubripirellula tenax]TWU44655.1 hypothetical protein Poly51_59240 [Rubripirellula tenax]
MAVITTLGFAGRTEEALAFYREALDAETVFLMRFRDCPDQSHAEPGMEDLIFHATFRIDGSDFMASDVGFNDIETPPEFAGFSLLLRFDSTERAKRAFACLADRGTIVIPFEKSAFTDWYGIVVDRFGVSWKFNVQQDGG